MSSETGERFGEDVTAAQMYEKRQTWSELLAGEDYAGKAASAAIKEIGELTGKSQYPILSSVLDTPLNEGSNPDTGAAVCLGAAAVAVAAVLVIRKRR